MSRAAFSAAVNWWIQGLALLCPAPLRRLVRGGRAFCTIEFQADQVVFRRYARDPEAAPDTREFRPDDEIGRSAALDWLRGQGAGRGPIILCAPDNLLLKKRLAFPKAAAGSLRQVLAFEMNRQTPFSAEQVYFDYRLEGETGADKIQLELYLAPKKQLDAWLELLSGWGVTPDAIRPAREARGDALNLIPPEARPGRPGGADQILLWLAGAVFVLSVMALYAPVINQQRHIASLEAGIATHRTAAQQLQALRQEQARLLAETRFLTDKRGAEPPGLELLREITRIMPADTWLMRLVMEAGELQLIGESGDAAALIPILEASAYFDNAEFRSPITRNTASGKDRFHMAARLSPAAAP